MPVTLFTVRRGHARHASSLAARCTAFVLAEVLVGECYNCAPLTTVPQPGVTLVAELTTDYRVFAR